jgi:hypothetical protein
MDTIVDRPAVEVLRVRADMKGKGPKAAFDVLESKLPTLKGRRFFGTFRMLDDGEEYYACVDRVPTDDPAALGLEVGTIPGGRYIRRRVWDWESVVAAGKMKEISEEFARGYVLDPDRPSIEFYRSMKELHILLPLAATTAPPPARIESQ